MNIIPTTLLLKNQQVYVFKEEFDIVMDQLYFILNKYFQDHTAVTAILIENVLNLNFK